MHNQFPLFKSPLRAYLLEQASLNYFLYHLAPLRLRRGAAASLPDTLGRAEPIFIYLLSHNPAPPSTPPLSFNGVLVSP